MRWLFLLLVLANAGYFGWQTFRDAPASLPPSSAGSPSMGLALLNELPESERPALREAKPVVVPPAEEAPSEGAEITPVAEVPEAVVEVAPPRQCLELKGFEKSADAEQVMKGLLSRGMQLEARGETMVPKVNYWVLLPPYNSRKEAEAVILQLKAHKLRDFYRVRSGESTNAISLGVFSNREIADRRYKQVVGLRLKTPKPQIKLLELHAKRYWLRLSFHGEQMVKWRDLLQEGAAIEGREWQCEESR